MKSKTEMLAKERFDEFLNALCPADPISWIEVPQADEPPDYCLRLGKVEYAVEVTTLMEKVTVGELRLSTRGIVNFLWNLVGEVETAAKRDGVLRGAYLVSFLSPIENLREIKDTLQSDLLDYIRTTKNLTNTCQKLVLDRGRQRCAIEKIHDRADSVYLGGPAGTKWDGEIAEEICQLLEERIKNKSHKLRGLSQSMILLLYDSYRFADRQMYRNCLSQIGSVTDFHSIFVVAGNEESFMLYSENRDWL